MIGSQLSRIFHVCYLLVFAVVLGCVLAVQDNLATILALWLIGIFGLLCIRKRLGKIKITDAQLNIVTAGTLAVMALLMAAIGWMMLPLLKTDLGTVYYSAMEIIEKGRVNDILTDYNRMTMIRNMTNNEYFVVYPNNLPILFFLTVFYRGVCALGISMASDLGVYMGVLLNIASILLSVWIGSRTACKIWGKKGALTYLGFAAFFLPYYINASRFYTDTLTLVFPVLAVYLYIRIRETGELKKRAAGCIALGLCLTAGFLLKGSCIIVAVALVIHSFISGLNRRTLAAILIAACVFGVSYQAWQSYVRNCSWIDMSREDALTFPAVHWIMMALSGNGGFRQEDFDYTYSFEGKKEKQAADIERAREKLEELGGAGGFIRFEMNKIALTWGDGKFAQQAHLEWMQKDTWVQEFVNDEGRYYPVFYVYTRAFVVILYTLFLFSAAGGCFRKNGIMSVINICIFGVLLFFAVWETKSRYLLNYTPLFFLCAIDGLNVLKTGVEKLRK